MIKELRGLTWSKILSYPINRDMNLRMSIGTEGCAKKFCHDMEEILSLDEDFNFELTLVTPRVGEELFYRLVGLIHKICHRYIIKYIVVNDYGVLNELQKSTYENIIIGRTLIRSLAYVPWCENLVVDETPKVKLNLFLPSIVHNAKIEFFKNYHIYGVELCATPLLEMAVNWLNANDVKIFYHYNTTISSIGRTCPYTRLMNNSVTECNYQCSEMLNVKLCQIWNAHSCLYEEKDVPSEFIIPEFFNIENVLYHITKNDEVFSLDVDTVCYHVQFNE